MKLCLLLMSLAGLLLTSQKADIVFAGDAMMHRSQLDDARRADGTYDFSDYFSDVKPYVDSADFAIVNLETPLSSPPYSGYPLFNAPVSYAEALKEAGFDLFMLANNHMLDRRGIGLKNTIEALDRMEVEHVGAYRDIHRRDSVVPVIKEINGFRIAFLNYTFSTNGLPVDGGVVVDMLDRNLIKRDIEAARSRGAELITVMPHWGNEYVSLPPSHVKAMCDYISSLGPDIIMGGHPHVVQPMKIIPNPVDSSRKQLIVYSMGNFISGMRTDKTRGGAMVKATLSRDSLGRAIVDAASYRLVYTVPPGMDRARPHYHLVYPDYSTPDRRALIFRDHANSLFEKHNIHVPSR